MASGQVGGWLDPLKIRINLASVEVEAELGNSNYESKKYLTVYLLCYDSCRAEVSIKLPRSAVLWTLLTDNRKVSIKLPRSAVFWTPGIEMRSDNRKVSIKLPRSAVLWTLKFRCQNTAKVRSFMDTFA